MKDTKCRSKQRNYWRRIENSVADFCGAVEERGIADLRGDGTTADSTEATRLTMIAAITPLLVRVTKLLDDMNTLLENLTPARDTHADIPVCKTTPERPGQES